MFESWCCGRCLGCGGVGMAGAEDWIEEIGLRV
jgi:hypothetical protein